MFITSRSVRCWTPSLDEARLTHPLPAEYLLGRGYDNALLNLGVRQPYNEGLKGLGFNMEDVIDVERDMGLGNGGLGRLAACYLDSTSTLDIPCWGYTLRYSQGSAF